MSSPYTDLKERHVILSRIASALRDVTEKDPLKDVPITTPNRGATRTPVCPELADEGILGLFSSRCRDYNATVTHTASADDLSESLAEEAVRLGIKSLVIPPGIEPDWLIALRKSGITVVCDEPPLDKLQLNGIDGVLTTCALAIAETGTLVLDHSKGQGRRIVSLLPNVHLCVVRAEDVVLTVPEAVVLLKPSIREGRPVTIVSGPSATVDIEFERVVGVHGPHHLSVFVHSEQSA